MANRAILGPGINAGGPGWTLLTFTGTPFNSLAASSLVTNLAPLTNGSYGDQIADVSFTFLNGATTTTGASQAQLFMQELNGDGTTYGDGSQNIGTTSTVVPRAQSQVGSLNHKVGIASGGALFGTFTRIPLIYGTFLFSIMPNTNGALNAAASAQVWWRTYLDNLNG